MKSSASLPHVTISTDGACLSNPGPGGWAALLRYDGKDREISGGQEDTTNNRMEMIAVIQALQVLKKPCRVTLRTDSQYVCRGMTEWIEQWQARGWKTAGKKPVLNKDLWQELIDAARRHRIDWIWVKGHAGDADNEYVDKLARKQAQMLAGQEM